MTERLFGHRVVCPFCGWSGESFPVQRHSSGAPFLVPDEWCPGCLSRGRERLLWAYLLRRRAAFTRRLTVLDVGPAECVKRTFRGGPSMYVSVDIVPRAQVRGDICRLPVRDGAASVVICFHVLEHVVDDESAMAELRRVVSQDGVVLVQTPMWDGSTVTDPAASPEERSRRFGSDEHVRVYGRDLSEKLFAVGFVVREEHIASSLAGTFVRRIGVRREEWFYVCVPA